MTHEELDVMQENDMMDLYEAIAELEEENDLLMGENQEFYNRELSLRLATQVSQASHPGDAIATIYMLTRAEQFYHYLTQTEND